jgi:CRP-like cAMP-binding protein/HEAT repeat protein
MSRALSKFFNLREGEGPKVIVLLVMFFLFIIGTTWAETIIEASYYYQVGVSQISTVFMLHAGMSLIATAVYTAFVDQISNQKLLVVLSVIAIVAIGAGLILLEINQVAGYTILYVLVRAIRTSFVIHWWNYCSDYYDTRAAKRIVPIITSASRLAIIAAGLTIPLLTGLLSPEQIIGLWVITLLIIALMTWVMNRVVPASVETLAPKTAPRSKERGSYLRNIREGFQYVSSSNYLRWISLATFLMVIIFALLNYQGGLIFKQQFETREAMTNFIGQLNGWTSLIMLPVQLFLFSRIVGKIGVGNANVIYPLGTFFISGAVIFAPFTLLSGALAHFDRNTFRYSTQEASNNLLYNAVPMRVKGRARSFIDGAVLPVALIASSGLLELGKLLPPEWFLPVLLGIPALAFLVCSLVIRQLYTRAMITLLEQEDYSALLPSSDNVELSADPAALNILGKKLAESQNDSVTLLIARIMLEAGGSAALPILEEKAKSSQPALRAGIIDTITAADLQENAVERFYTAFINDPDENVRLSVFIGLENQSQGNNKQLLDWARQLLKDPSFNIRRQALTVLLNADKPEYAAPAETNIRQLLNDPAPVARACALDALAKTNQPRFLPSIAPSLQDPDDSVRLSATLALEHYVQNQPQALPILLQNAERLLQDPVERIRTATIGMLAHSRSPEAYPLITRAMSDPSVQVREFAAENATKLGEKLTSELLQSLQTPTISAQQKRMLAAVLCRINPRQYGSLVDEQIQSEIQQAYQCAAQLHALHNLPTTPGLMVLRAILHELKEQALTSAFYLLTARHDEKSVRRIVTSLNSHESRTISNASEALESLSGAEMARLIIPLYENKPEEIAQINASQWGATPANNTSATLRAMLETPASEWIQAFALYALAELYKDAGKEVKVEDALPKRRPSLLDKLLDDTPPPQPETAPPAPTPLELTSAELTAILNRAQTDENPQIQSAALAAQTILKGKSASPLERKNMGASLSVIERIIFLKQVSFFQGMSIDQLKVLASICEEELIPAGTSIFQEGDSGGTLYVVVDGRISIEREGERKGSIVRLAAMEPRSSFGEMSLFENSPRSASAVAIEDSLVLKLSVAPLVVLMRQYPDMSLELIKVLSLRMREAKDQISRLTRSMPRQLHKVYDRLQDSENND